MTSKIKNRYFVVLGAILIQLCLGAIYAWSVFTPALNKAGWSHVQTQVVFSVGLVFYALVMVLAGKKLRVWGPRKLTIMGALALGLGYFLAGLVGGTNFWAILIFIGVVGGSGIGLGYVVPISVGMQWFPDKKGLITGLAVAGFGFGAMFWVKLAGSWGNLISSLGLSATFMIYGVAFAGLVLLGSIWMIYPPEGWKPEGFNTKADDNGGLEDEGSFSTSEMLNKPQFYMIFTIFLFTASAGLMSIGLMKLFPIQALTKNGISLELASSIAGTAMAVFFSIANGLGRIIWGVISDKIGRKNSIVIMALSQSIMVFLFTKMAGTPALLYLGATIIGFNFGGNFSLFPTITADMFGQKNVGENYPMVFLSYGIGGVFGPILGGMLGDMGNFGLAFMICSILCLIGAIIAALIKPPHHERS